MAHTRERFDWQEVTRGAQRRGRGTYGSLYFAKNALMASVSFILDLEEVTPTPDRLVPRRMLRTVGRRRWRSTHATATAPPTPARSPPRTALSKSTGVLSVHARLVELMQQVARLIATRSVRACRESSQASVAPRRTEWRRAFGVPFVAPSPVAASHPLTAPPSLSELGTCTSPCCTRGVLRAEYGVRVHPGVRRLTTGNRRCAGDWLLPMSSTGRH